MSRRSGRRYRMTDEGEQPIWASPATLRRMAREDAGDHHRGGYGPEVGLLGNPVYDEEYRRERARLAQEEARRPR